MTFFYFWIRQYPYKSQLFCVIDILCHNFPWSFSVIISPHSYRVIICVINLSLRFIFRFGRFHEDFPLKEGTVRVSLPFSKNRPENHSHNLGKSLGEGLGLLCAPFTSLSLSPLSLSLSLSLSIYIYTYISPSTFLSLSLLLSIFSLSFSLAYLMDVFVLVYFRSLTL